MITRRQALAAGAALATGASLPNCLWAGPHHALPRTQRLRLCDGRWLAYREYGCSNGPLVLHFHGTPGSRLELALCADEALCAKVRMVAVDRPGMGCSSYQPCRRILDWPGDILQLAAALGYSNAPFGIVGLSGGAPYAAACAYAIPNRLTHVAIVSGHSPMNAPGTCRGNQDDLIELVARRPKLAKGGFRLIGRRLNRRPDKLVPRLAKNWSAEDRKLILYSLRRYGELVANLRESIRCSPTGLVTDIRLLACNWGFCLSNIQNVPVSIWQGGCDPIVTPSMAHYFHRQINGSSLTIDPRAGHITMFKWHAGAILSQFAA